MNSYLIDVMKTQNSNISKNKMIKNATVQKQSDETQTLSAWGLKVTISFPPFYLVLVAFFWGSGPCFLQSISFTKTRSEDLAWPLKYDALKVLL